MAYRGRPSDFCIIAPTSFAAVRIPRRPPRTWGRSWRLWRPRIQAGERAKGKKQFWGFCSGRGRLTRGADLRTALEWQAAEGGGAGFIEEDQTISVNNPQAIRAVAKGRRALGWFHLTSKCSWIQRVGFAERLGRRRRGFHAELAVQPTSTARAGRGRQFEISSPRPCCPVARQVELGNFGRLGVGKFSQFSAIPVKPWNWFRYLTRRDVQVEAVPRFAFPQPPTLPELLQLA